MKKNRKRVPVAPFTSGTERSEVECAGHGWEIGGASPLRGLSEATASRRQLHGAEADLRVA